ncbi:MAG: class I SAM-dependent DNA methyltransferase [Parvularculaceae bacterium]
MDFKPFDARNYPTLGVREGYAAWSSTYESTVLDEMDIRLLERIETVDWAAPARALDLACGTGRTGRWLANKGAQAIDGVDLMPEMLEKSRARGVYTDLTVADIRDTGFKGGRYGLVTVVLADEHLPDLGPLYREARRLAREDGAFVIVGYHSHFLMNGIPTHFNAADGAPRAIESHVHLFSDHVRAAHSAGWSLAEMHEGLVDEDWIAKKPKWKRFLRHPVSFAMVWRAAGAADACG